jgi:hypothetical protein
MCDGVVGRVVEVVGPLVDLVGPNLDRFRPGITVPDIHKTVWAEHTHHFAARYLSEILSNNQVYKVVNVGQASASQPVNRHPSVEIAGLNMLAGSFDVCRISVEAVDHVPIVWAQHGREFSIAAAKVDDEPPLDTSFAENPPGLLRVGDERKTGNSCQEQYLLAH